MSDMNIMCYTNKEHLYKDINSFRDDIKRFADSHVSLKFKHKSGMIGVVYITVDKACCVTLTYKPSEQIDFDKINSLAVLPINSN